MSEDVEELQIPDRVGGKEVARIFLREDDHAIFLIDTTLQRAVPDSDPIIEWGILLADFTKHVANALATAVEDGRLVAAEGQDLSRDNVLAILREEIAAELDDPDHVVHRLTDS